MCVVHAHVHSIANKPLRFHHVCSLKARLEQIEGHVHAWRQQESAAKEAAAADSTSTNGSSGSREPLGMSAAAPGG